MQPPLCALPQASASFLSPLAGGSHLFNSASIRHGTHFVPMKCLISWWCASALCNMRGVSYFFGRGPPSSKWPKLVISYKVPDTPFTSTTPGKRRYNTGNRGGRPSCTASKQLAKTQKIMRRSNACSGGKEFSVFSHQQSAPLDRLQTTRRHSSDVLTWIGQALQVAAACTARLGKAGKTATLLTDEPDIHASGRGTY